MSTTSTAGVTRIDRSEARGLAAAEFEKFAEKIRPDLVGSGVKEKYIFQKMGIPFRQMHSWDYSGPYHGYDGFAIFARDMDMTLNNPCWKNLTPPWLKPVEEEQRAIA